MAAHVVVATEFDLAFHPVGPMVGVEMLFGTRPGRVVLPTAGEVVGSLPDGVKIAR